jgi:hypothetical protein
MRKCLAVACLGLGVLFARAADAQQGMVRGTVRDETGRPVALAYVMALRAPDAILDPVLGTVTDSAGRYLLRGLAPGTFHLRVRRLGWRLGDPVAITVAADGSVERDLVAAARPVEIAAVRVVAAPPCLDKNSLHSEPQVQALWAGASDAVRARVAIHESYAFTQRHRMLAVVTDGGADTTQNVDSLETWDPTAARRSSAVGGAEELFGTVRRTGLFRRGWRISLRAPSDGVLTSDAFLGAYCVLAAIESDTTGDLLVRFRPIREDPKRVTATGVVRLDPDDGRTKRVDFSFHYDDQVVGTGRSSYDRVRIDGVEVSWMTDATFEILHPRRGEPYFSGWIRRTPSDFRRVVP